MYLCINKNKKDMKKYQVKILGNVVGVIAAKNHFMAMLKGSAIWAKGNTAGVSVIELN